MEGLYAQPEEKPPQEEPSPEGPTSDEGEQDQIDTKPEDTDSEEGKGILYFFKVKEGPGNEARYRTDVFQNNRLIGRITALLDLRAALNVLSSKMEGSLGLRKNTQGLSTSMLPTSCRQKCTKTATSLLTGS